MKLLVALVLWTLLILQFEINHAARSVLKWNKHLQDFEQIFVESSLKSEKKEHALRAEVEETTNLTDFKQILVKPSLESEKEEHALRARVEETHNFNGQVLKLTYFKEHGMVHFNEKDAKLTGVVGDVWTMLSEMLNFTLVLRKGKSNSLGYRLSNGTYNGIYDLFRLNQTDIIPKVDDLPIYRQPNVYFTQPLWQTKYSYWTRPQRLDNHAWMFNVFSVEVWTLISVYILTMSVIRAVAERMSIRKTDRKIRPKSYLDHLFNTFGMTCNQGDVLSATSGSRIVAIIISLFSWLILIVYSSRLITNLTQNNFQASRKYVKDLFSTTTLRYLVYKGSYCDLYIKHEREPRVALTKNKGHITAVPNLNHLYNKICLQWHKNILFDTEDAVVARSSQICNLVPIIDHELNSIRHNVVSSINKRVKNMRSFDIGLMKLRESGLMDAFKKRHWFSKKGAEDREAESLEIDMNQVAYIFAILACGIVASIVICIAENIIFALKNCKKSRRPILRNRQKIGCRYEKSTVDSPVG